MRTEDYLCNRDSMGIYDSEKIFSFSMSSKKIIYIAIFVLSVVFVVIAAIFLSSMLNPPIEARFIENPLVLSNKKFTLLEVKITNVTESDARNVEVFVSARDKSAIMVGYSSEDRKMIDTIERSQYRKLNFLVTPREGINEGSYVIDIRVKINDKVFTKEVALMVKN
ncbi:MAG: hypothetical protein QXM75_04680 [Candidatus Diapherotrites archaeon]